MPRSILNGRIPQPGEPWFLDDDRDGAIALTVLEADLCHGCGQPMSESMDAANEFAYQVTVLRCHACAAIKRKGHEDRDTPEQYRWGLQHYVTHERHQQ